MRLLLTAVLIAQCCVATAHADATLAIEARQGLFKEFKDGMGGMKKMLKDPAMYDEKGFEQLAKELQASSDKQWGSINAHFPKGSDVGDTDAKPEIWTQWAEFKAAADKNRKAVAELAKIASKADHAAAQAAVASVGQSCKGCHDKFKRD